MLLFLILYAAQARVQSCTGDPNVAFYETSVEGSIQYFHWSGVDTVFLVTSTAEGGRLYLSRDEGATWIDQRASLPGFDEVQAPSTKHGVFGLFLNSQGSRAALTSYREGVWLSSAPAFSWQWVGTPGMRFHTLYPSPHDEEEILGLTMTPECYDPQGTAHCYTKLMLSKNFGRTWQLVSEYTQRVQWDYDNPGKFYYLEYDVKEGAQLQADPTKATLYAHERSQSVGFAIQRACAGFILRENTMLAARFEQGSLELYVSFDDGKSLKRMYFPATEKLSETGYMVLSMDEGSVFVAVAHASDNWSNLYVAGAADGSFELSLERLAGFGSQADFAQLGSVPGVYIANQVSEDGLSRHTLRTDDNGALWKPLDNLQLAGPSEPATRFYSVKSAVGLMAANGAPGTSIQPSASDMHTYLTNDAGVSWKKISDAPTIYEFGDRGGLLLMAETTGVATGFSFTWNEGATVTRCDLSTRLEVDNIRIEPNSKSQRFIMHGRRADKHVLIAIDFSKKHERLCALPDQPGTPESDYQLWTPTQCVLGETVQYVRRIPSKECFNTVDDSHHVRQPCPCTRDSYICDDCFVDTDSGLCVRYSSVCNNAQYTQGYRKAPGNKCSPEDPRYARKGTPPAPGPSSGPHEPSSSTYGPVLIILGIVLIFVVAVVAAGVAARKHAGFNRLMRKCFPESCCPLQRASDAHYGTLGEHSLDLEEEADLMSMDEMEEEPASFGDIFS